MAGNLTAMIAAAFSGGAAPPVTSDPYFEYTTLLLPGNGTNGAQNNTFLDGSTNNFTITRNGNTTQGTFSPFSQTGWGNYFDGTGDYLSAASNTAFAFGTGEWTIECWVYASAIDVSSVFFSCGTNGTQLGTNGSGNLAIAQTGVAFEVNSSTTLPLNQWNHVAAVRNSSNSSSIFLNGTRIANGTLTTNYSSSGTAYANYNPNSVGSDFTGYMSGLRVVKGTAVYDPTQTTITVPTAPLTAISGTSLLTCQSNRFIDNSSNNFTITPAGNTSVVAFSPFNPSASWSAATYGGSGYFDGTGDFLTAANNTAFDLSGSISWCIELWAYWNNTSGEQNILEKFAYTPAGWTLYKQTTGAIELYNGSTTTSFSTVVANQWYHIVLCRDNATNTFSFYLNGTRTSTSSLSIASNAATSLVVGARTSSSNYFNGYMSGVRIVKGSSVYDPSQTTLTVPTSPPTAITNTSLLLNFTNAGIHDATSKNDLETVGDAQISTTQSKWGSGSMYFDGTGDWLLSPASTLYAFNTGDFTIEGWVYIGATPANACLFDTRNGFGTGGFGVFITNGTGIAIYTSSGTTIFTATSCLTTSAWQHLAITRNGTNFRVFVNGTQISSTVTNSANMSDGYLIIANALAADRNYPFTGYIQDFRITKGYARYTANFTAPTAAFPTL